MNTPSRPPRKQTWNPFKRPKLSRFTERRLSKVAVIDVGSNSVRLVIFDGAARSPAYFYNEKILCGLGEGLATRGTLNPEGRERALNAILRFKSLTKTMGIKHVIAAATAAVRSATDGVDFCHDVYKKTGQKIWIIDGLQEAHFAAQGVLLGWPGAYGLVCDLGGSSMELAEIGGGDVLKTVTSNLGPLKLKDLEGGKTARDDLINKTLTSLAKELGPQNNRLFLVGGSWRALARIDMYRRDYPLNVLHEYRMTETSVLETLDFLRTTDEAKLQSDLGMSTARLSLLPYAGEVLTHLLTVFAPVDIAISSYGLREGMLYEQMTDDIRRRDPLIEAAKFAEKKDARVPGVGKSLLKFVSPLFPDASEDTMRIIAAACYLHDVSWRTHPDYRAQICFDNATRANLGGLTHSERVFLGLALMHRYSNKRSGKAFETLLQLLDPERMTQAEVLGKAMRLGAMMWVSDDQDRAHLEWDPNSKSLTLVLSEAAGSLYGEVAQGRLASLSSAMQAEASCRLSTC